VSDKEREEFEFEPIEGIDDPEEADDELADLEPLGPLDDAELADADEPAEASRLDDAEAADAIEPLDDAEMVDAAEPGDDEIAEVAEGEEIVEAAEGEVTPDDAAFPAEEGLAGFAADADTGEEAAEEDEDEEAEKKPKKKKKDKLLASIRQASPYTIMLIIAFVALLVGTLCLMGELSLYEFDIKAEKAKRTGAMLVPVYSAPEKSMAAACPTGEKLILSIREELG